MTPRLSLTFGIVLVTSTLGCGGTRPDTTALKPIIQPAVQPSQGKGQEQKDINTEGKVNVANLGGVVKDDSKKEVTSTKAADQAIEGGIIDKSQMTESNRTDDGNIQDGHDNIQFNGPIDKVEIHKGAKPVGESSFIGTPKVRTYADAENLAISVTGSQDTAILVKRGKNDEAWSFQILTGKAAVNPAWIPINAEEPQVEDDEVEVQTPAVSG